MKYPKYNVDYMINNVYNGTEIFIKYNDVNYFIGFCAKKQPKIFFASFITKKLLKRNIEGYYFITKYNDNTNIQKYDTPKSLFKNAMIEDKKLIDIWDKVEITSISGLDKY